MDLVTPTALGRPEVLNHLCALGEVEKMYIPPAMDLKLGIFGNQLLWEARGPRRSNESHAAHTPCDDSCVCGICLSRASSEPLRLHSHSDPAPLTSRTARVPPTCVTCYSLHTSEWHGNSAERIRRDL